MNKWDKILADFVGKDKVISLDIYEDKSGKWVYKYKEKIGKQYKIHTLIVPDRATAERYHFQFGGKNPSTVSCPDKFTKLGEWRSDAMRLEGHKITEINLSGMRIIRNKRIPLDFPPNTGHHYLISKKKNVDDKHHLILRDHERLTITRVFKNGREFDQFVDFLLDNELTKNLTFHIMSLTTENTDLCIVGKWKRCKAQDGTSRMILELKKIDGKDYQDVIYMDILNYADGLADAECRKIPKGKAQKKEDTVCYFAAKEGKFE